MRNYVPLFPPPNGKFSGCGLALSGGGIRSATFSLGVLQALAIKGKLATFDYLSTVSGGGYIGSWLSAWIHRDGLFQVQTQLARVGSRNGIPPDTNEPPEVTWLRKYSNYLAPRLGLFSMDSLTLVTTWLRNVFLNQIILIAFVATLLLIPRLLLKPTQWALQISDCYGIAAAALSICCIYFIGLNVDRNAKETWRVGQKVPEPQKVREWPWLFTTKLGVPIILLLAMFTAIFGSIWLFSADPFDAAAIITRFGWLLLPVGFAWFIVGIIYNFFHPESRWLGWGYIYAIIYAAAILGGSWLFNDNEFYAEAIGPTVTLAGGLLLILLGGIWYVAEVLRRISRRDDRKWWGLLCKGAFFYAIMVTYVIFCLFIDNKFCVETIWEPFCSKITLAGGLLILLGGLWFFAWVSWKISRRGPEWWVQWLCWDAFIYAGAAIFTVALAAGCAWWVRNHFYPPVDCHYPYPSYSDFAYPSYSDFAARLVWRMAPGDCPYPSYSDSAALLTFGPSGFMIAFGVCGWIFMGLVGRTYLDPSREWWSRMNAWFLTLGLVWFSLCALAFYGSAFLEWVDCSIPTWAGVIGSAGWIGSLLTTLLVPKPAGLSITKSAYFDRALNVAAAFSVVGLLLLLAALVHWSLIKGAGLELKSVEPAKTVSELHLQFHSGVNQVTSIVKKDVTMKEEATASFKAYRDARMKDLANLADPEKAKRSFFSWMDYFFSAFVCVLVVLALFCWRVDVNTFSLHNMYKNRLIRCYLGASNRKRQPQPFNPRQRPSPPPGNRKRQPQPFTGFDDGDDIALTDLWNQGRYRRVQRPYHILNATLNISQGKNLAWQERKAASFIFSSYLCGYWLSRTQGDSSRNDEDSKLPARYQETKDYATDDFEAKGFTLGMAMATSGAAVSPNMGRATQPMYAFLLTLFDLRLGRWSPNPALGGVKKPGPSFALLPLLLELFGLANEESNFVYLSDGGHFDNLGLYELVRLGLDVIMVVDAGADPNRRFADIAEAVRKCRVDFGVEIKLDLAPLRTSSDDRLSEEGFTEGYIKYGNGKVGKLILIKPSLCKAKDEPADVLEYAQRNPAFPQHTTADQFFDESRFESYRRLGLFIGTRCLEKHARYLPNVDIWMIYARTFPSCL